MSDKTKSETKLLLNGIAFNAGGECSRKPSTRASWRRRLLIGVLLIETCFALPKLADGQFLSIFDSIFSSIQSDIGGSLSQINQVAQQMQKLYQTTVAPLAAINQARGFVAKLDQQFSRPDEPDIQYVIYERGHARSATIRKHSAQPAVSANPCLAGQLHDKLWGDPAGQCSLAAGPRDDGCR